MKQEVKLVARTFEIDNVAQLSDYCSEELAESTGSEMVMLSGKAAGVCYMPDDYMENGIQNNDRAIARAEQASESGHHSVFDHGHLTFVIKTNKMMAMILNSLGVYTTSEKSARYTKMQPETELELQMYEKWRVKIKELILDKYPNIDDDVLNAKMLKALNIDDKNEKVVKNGKLLIDSVRLSDEIFDKQKESDTLPSSKLAQENARYMISVFTPTTMMYTISYRQAFLTMDYLEELINNCSHAKDPFSKRLTSSVMELLVELRRVLDYAVLHDNKNQHIRFLEAQYVGEMEGSDFKCFDDLEQRLETKRNIIGDSYTLVYEGSLAMLAQAQRHRTLRYTMCLQDAGERGYYTPEIVKDAGLEDEWQEDIKGVAYCIPQGTMVRITEQGLFEDFALKCKERMCGRAQLEIMKSTTNSVKLFIENKDNLSYSNQKLLESMTLETDERGCNGLTPCARCKFKDFKCSEGCKWGPSGALNRLI